MLDKQPRFHDDKVGGVPKEEEDEYFKEGYFVDTTEPDLLVRLADRKANLVYNKKLSLFGKEWNQFEQLLAQAN